MFWCYLPTDCGSDATTSIATGDSFSLEYLNPNISAYCEWTFSVDDGRYIYIQFEIFSIEPGPYPYGDYLHFGSIDDGDAYGSFTGFEAPQDFVIPDNIVLITFISDGFGESEGFLFTISDVNPEGNFDWGSPHRTLDPDLMRIKDPDPTTILLPHRLNPDPSCACETQSSSAMRVVCMPCGAHATPQ